MKFVHIYFWRCPAETDISKLKDLFGESIIKEYYTDNFLKMVEVVIKEKESERIHLFSDILEQAKKISEADWYSIAF